MNILQNDLRIINGQLILYSYQYYNALHAQTRILADLTNELDMLGASIDKTFVKSYGNQQKTVSTTDFELNYNTVFSPRTSQKTPLFNYNNIKAEYLNNFFDAQQRFLKAMYDFKQYFNHSLDIDNFYEHQLT